MDKIKQKLVNGLAIAFLALMAAIYVVSFVSKNESKATSHTESVSLVKSYVSLTNVDNTAEFNKPISSNNHVLEQLFFDSVRHVTYAENEDMEFYQIAYDSYLLSATHYLPVKYQKEKWTYYCVDTNGDMLDTKYLKNDTEQILRAICLQNKPKNK